MVAEAKTGGQSGAAMKRQGSRIGCDTTTTSIRFMAIVAALCQAMVMYCGSFFGCSLHAETQHPWKRRLVKAVAGNRLWGANLLSQGEELLLFIISYLYPICKAMFSVHTIALCSLFTVILISHPNIVNDVLVFWNAVSVFRTLQHN